MTVFEADWVCNAAAPPLAGGAISVANGRIVQVGPGSEIHGVERKAFGGCAIIPGFVNAHTHLELTLLRGFLEDLSFREWIQCLTHAKYKTLGKEDLRLSARLGAIEMLRAGVTTVGEIMDLGHGWEAMQEYGLQGVAYQEVFGPAEAVAPQALSDLKRKVEVFRVQETATQRVGVSPHAPYTVSERLYRAVGSYARQAGLPLSAHLAESREEIQFVKDGIGPFEESLRNRGIEVVPRHCTPVAYFEALGLLGPDMLLAHAIEADDQDLARLAASQTRVVHCPKSNGKLGHGIARVRELREAGVAVGLGTDSVVSNNAVDMFEEMRACVYHQRIRYGSSGAFNAAAAFQMATLDGARCLGLEKHVGSLETGKRADFVVVDLSGIATSPVFDPIDALVYSASRGDVKTTFLAGREVVVDDAPLRGEAESVARKLRGTR